MKGGSRNKYDIGVTENKILNGKTALDKLKDCTIKGIYPFKDLKNNIYGISISLENGDSFSILSSEDKVYRDSTVLSFEYEEEAND